MIGRPTHREVSRKIRLAQQAVELRAIQLVDFVSLLSDAEELGDQVLWIVSLHRERGEG